VALTIPYSFTNGVASDALEVNENFEDVAAYVNTSLIHKDASVAFTAVPSGPASDPSSDNHLARKAYVDRHRLLGIAELTSTTGSLSSGNAIPGLSLSVAVVSGRRYRISYKGTATVGNTGARWSFVFRSDSTEVDKIAEAFRALAGVGNTHAVGSAIWTPGSSATRTIDIVVNRNDGAGNIAVAASSTARAQLVVEEVLE
jgi:hypothetical protein